MSPRDFSTMYRPEPTARAELRATLDGPVWHVARCPFCRRPHDYQAGSLDGDPRAFLGLRLSLCSRARWHVLEAERVTPGPPALYPSEDLFPAEDLFPRA